MTLTLVSERMRRASDRPLDVFWTPEMVEDQLVLMVRVSSASGRVGPKLSTPSWWNTLPEPLSIGEQAKMLQEGDCEVARDSKAARDAERNRVKRVFSSKEISRADQALSWWSYLPAVPDHGVRGGVGVAVMWWVCAHKVRGRAWRAICRDHGWDKDTQKRRAMAGLEMIAAGLNRDRVLPLNS